MSHLPSLIIDLTVVLVVAGVVTILFQWLRQPIVLGYLIAGIVVGPYTSPIIHVNDVGNIFLLAELGVIFLMFSLGLEFSFRKLASAGFSATITGFVEVLVMLGVGFLLANFLGWKFYDALFLGAAIAISSTTIIIKAIDDLKLKHKRFVGLVFGVLIVEDLLAILLLVLLSTLVSGKTLFSMGMLWATLKLIVVVGGWFIIGYFAVPYWINRVSHVTSSETLTVISVALCLGLSVLAARFGYSIALGAFIMGSILAETSQIHLIEKLIAPIKNIFGATFFVSVGMLINPSVIWQNWQTVLLISIVVIVAKIFSSMFGAMLTGQKLSTSLQVGFSMAQIGEFSFIIANLGLGLGVISPSFYPIIVAVSGVTTFTTPYLIKYSSNFNAWLMKYVPEKFLYFFDSYASWIYKASSRAQEKQEYRKAIIRLILNGIIVAIIFSLVANYLFPYGYKMFQRTFWADIFIWVSSLFFSLPFLWGMVFAFRRCAKKTFQFLPAYAATISFSLAEIFFLSIYFFGSWAIASTVLLTALGLFVIFYRHVEKYYYWFEERLVNNFLTEQETPEKMLERLAPWEHFFARIQVPRYSNVAFKKLSEIGLREKYHVNVVGIQRDAHVISTPRGEQIIYPHDTLLLLGEEAQVEKARELFESQMVVSGEHIHLDNFALEMLVLNPGSPFIGKSIRDSKIRELSAGNVVGLERDGKRILSPDPSMVLECNDRLLIVGEAKKLKQLKDSH
ncbi:MAG: ybaL 1 [Gammaproteobacteria bacterium]|jgi:CPA2 family monovalent cation:H+ antiporter-2|nr:ybaL 1 [Gammaproteobacteria bacterium]